MKKLLPGKLNMTATLDFELSRDKLRRQTGQGLRRRVPRGFLPQRCLPLRRAFFDFFIYEGNGKSAFIGSLNFLITVN